MTIKKMHSSKIQKSHQVLISVGFSSNDVMYACDREWQENRSLLLSVQGLLVTNGVIQHKVGDLTQSSFFSKSNKQCETEDPTAVYIFPHFLDFLRPAKRTNVILCDSHPWAVLFWTMEGFFYLIGFEKTVHFFLDKLDGSTQPAGSRPRAPWGPHVVSSGQMLWNKFLAFRQDYWADRQLPPT